MNYLDVQISSFPSVWKTNSPENVNLLEWLKEDHKNALRELRCLSGEAYTKQKKKLAGITPSGTFSNRSEDGLIEHSGLMQFDIDSKDNPVDMEELKKKIKFIPFVAYCSFSTSGNGLWGLIPIKHPDRHKAHFRAIEKAFSNAGITIDRKPSNVASFRFISYDPDPYFNVEAEVLGYTIEPAPARTTKRTYKPTDTRARVEQLISKIKTDITAGYENWRSIGFALEDEFGESGRGYFHAISKFYPGYSPKEADRKYEYLLEHEAPADKVRIGTFFRICREHGYTLDPYHAPSRDNGSQAKYEAAKNTDPAPYGFNPYTGEIFDERGYPADWDFHLN